MSVVDETLTKLKEIKTRVISTIDAFRPKILIKKPLSQIKILGEEFSFEGQGLSNIVERIHSRLSEIRSRVGLRGEETKGYEPETPTEPASEEKEVNALLVTQKKQRYGIHY